jgi:pilus assembly protein Flp/PilA
MVEIRQITIVSFCLWRVHMSSFIRKVKSVVVREEGATMVEYGLMVALVALVAIGGVTALGTSLNALFNSVVAQL